ncbi:spermidine/putrescine ABC transporter ATP-binding protein [Candidatus Aerophobetes bacterium]|uniref:Spermidine/putrescine ABC transporter ATP-binding protein n=1 Tax=Aerophobetes bacterium TaxID=2030807 RepID=A0A2A4X6C2_UNCAE|nr:MAG: spermidine/putrescine ABC transporter ATP-binding protein [Candidatus Aerophobetes bacterium]
MRSIRLKGISKSRESEKILDKINLTIPSGEFFALLGPSGCGKTTLLRIIAGLETQDEGTIHIGNLDISDLSINKRPVNMVFQNYALFPHLNIFNNVAYSLVIRKVAKDEIEAKVLKILKSFHLEKHIFKYPSQLSGGQQQRVALARAIINEPDVLLLDEPLAALDFKLREKMLLELIDLQDKIKTTFVYITHDQFEALTVADTMAIMNHNGEIEQIGTPKEIYEFPRSSFVAKFVGSTNLFSGTLHHLKTDPIFTTAHLGTFQCSLQGANPWTYEGVEASLSIRPEKIHISKKRLDNFINTLEGIVTQIVYYGRSTQYTVLVNNQFSVHVFEQNALHLEKPQESIDYDDAVFLHWHSSNSILLEV